MKIWKQTKNLLVKFFTRKPCLERFNVERKHTVETNPIAKVYIKKYVEMRDTGQLQQGIAELRNALRYDLSPDDQFFVTYEIARTHIEIYKGINEISDNDDFFEMWECLKKAEEAWDYCSEAFKQNESTEKARISIDIFKEDGGLENLILYR